MAAERAADANGNVITPALADGVEGLVRLAAEMPAGERRRLVQVVADLHTGAAERLTDRERALIRDVLRKLVRQVESAFRSELAARLGQEEPRELPALLRNGEIDIATVALLRGPLLEDQELVRAAAERTRRHELTLRLRRAAASERDAAGEDALRRLLDDTDPAIAAAAGAYLRESAAHLGPFGEPRLTLSELEPAVAARVAGLVAAALRARLLARFPIDPLRLDDALEAVLAAALPGEVAAGSEAAGELARLLADAGRISGTLLADVLRQGELPLFEALLTALSGLRGPRLGLLLHDPAGRGAAILCRALGVQRNAFASICLLLIHQKETKVADPRLFGTVIGFFDSVPREDALYVVRLWRRDPTFVDAVERLGEAGSRPCG